METFSQAMAEIEKVSSHVRLIADLMLAGPDLHDVDRGAFAQVLHDLAVRLERTTGRRAYVDARYSKSYQISKAELDAIEERVDVLKGLATEACRNKVNELQALAEATGSP